MATHGTHIPTRGGTADWQLRGDAQSGKRFVGDDCELCKDTQWSFERKQFPGARATK